MYDGIVMNNDNDKNDGSDDEGNGWGLKDWKVRCSSYDAIRRVM